MKVEKELLPYNVGSPRTIDIPAIFLNLGSAAIGTYIGSVLGGPAGPAIGALVGALVAKISLAGPLQFLRIKLFGNECEAVFS